MNNESTITLIIKAANLKYPDFKIECQLNWSVMQLKLHLSENYPTKPNVKFMRLIYFGKLLDNDDVKLHEFLRIGNEDIVHNIHIVYKSFVDDQVGKSSTIPLSATSSNHMDDTTRRASNGDQQIKTKKEQVRIEYQHIHSKLKEYYQQIGLNVVSNPWNSTYLQHTALYHHMHLNYLQSLGLNAWEQQPPPEINTQAPEESNTVQPEQPQQQQFQNDAEINRNEEREDDWLSLLHNFCSFLILFSIIYFYSSFTRFILVFCVVVLLVLYHSGWFTLERRRVRDENVQQAQQQQPEPQINIINQNQEINAENHGAPTATINAGIEQPQSPGFIRLVITFIVTFFTSLLPDRAVGRVQN